jgi:hypothetical protein
MAGKMLFWRCQALDLDLDLDRVFFIPLFSCACNLSRANSEAVFLWGLVVR